MEPVPHSYQYHKSIALAPLIFILVSVVHVPVECLDNSVEVDNLNMFNGRPFFARCTLQLENKFDERFWNSEFKMIHHERGTCKVSNFMIDGACQQEHKNHESESCGCSNNWKDMGVQFRFYYYIGEVKTTIDEGVSFKCSIQGSEMPGALTDTGFINVFGKDEDPAKVPILYTCEGEEVIMTYKFTQRSRKEQNDDPLEYMWVFKDQDWIASFEFQESIQSFKPIYNFSTTFVNRVSYLKLSDQQMTINITNIHDDDSGTYRVFFYYRRRKNEIPAPKIPLIDNTVTSSTPDTREIPLIDNTTTSSTPDTREIAPIDNTTTSSHHQARAINDNDTCSSNCTTTTEVTTAETTTTNKNTPGTIPPTSTTAEATTAEIETGKKDIPSMLLLPGFEQQPSMFFAYKKIITVTQPPEIDPDAQNILHFQYVSVTPTLNSKKSDTGRAVIFTCKATDALLKLGSPPIQLSLYHGVEELTRQVASHPLVFRLTNPDPNEFSKCVFTGPSLKCLKNNDRRRVGLLMKINKGSKDIVPVTFNSVTFLLAILINVILLWWTIMAVGHNINLIMARRRVLEIYSTKIILKNNAFRFK